MSYGGRPLTGWQCLGQGGQACPREDWEGVIWHGKVSHDFGRVSYGLWKVSDGLWKLSDGLVKVSDSLGNVSEGLG